MIELYQAFGIINITSAEQVRSLSKLIPVELIHKALALTDNVTLHKRKLPPPRIHVLAGRWYGGLL